MRTFKFRRWNKELKEMFMGLSPARDYPGSNQVTMQYTGLDDKNGCPIYEGDIIKIIWGDGKPATVEAALLVAWNDRRLGFAPFVSLCEDIDISEFKFEVIGNMFENPELIEETK